VHGEWSPLWGDDKRNGGNGKGKTDSFNPLEPDNSKFQTEKRPFIEGKEGSGESTREGNSGVECKSYDGECAGVGWDG
jgi:hypothetical protein